MDELDLIEAFFSECEQIESQRQPPPIVKDDTKWCVLDLETGGFDSSEDDIAEVAIVAYQGQREVNAFETLVKPYGRAMHAKAVEVHKITHADRVRKGVEPDRVFKKIINWLGPMEFVVAYNGDFDRGFIERHATYFGEVNESGAKIPYVIPQKTWVDPLDLAQGLGLGKKLNSLKLTELVRHFGIPLTEAHRALADSRATAAVFLALLEYGKCSLEEYGSGRLNALGPDMVHLPVFEALYGGQRKAHDKRKK